MGDDADRPPATAGNPVARDPEGPAADTTTEDQYVETFGGGDSGAVTLVGVVHDHPASVSRVRRVVEATEPAVLALELPPLAVPLYEAHAAGAETPPALGGEFSAAVDAASTDDVVGIDGPSLGFARRYLGLLARERVSPAVAGRSLRSLLSATWTAASCRAAARVTRGTPLRVGVGSVTPHGASWTDPPAERAADERREIRSAVAVQDSLEPPPPSRYRSRTRERHMADRLSTVRQRGDVVAVVGAGHFTRLSDAFGPAADPE